MSMIPFCLLPFLALYLQRKHNVRQNSNLSIAIIYYLYLH